MNAKLKLNLAAAGAGIALISQGWTMSEALAGPSLSGSSVQTFSAGASFSLKQGQSFESQGFFSGTTTPFAVTENPGSLQNTPVAGALNAGTSTLTAAFDTNGFADSPNTPSIAVQAGIISLGGSAPTAGVTTAPAGSSFKAGLALGLVFNQSTTNGIPTIQIRGASADSGIISASIDSESLGASITTGSFTDSLTVITGLSAF
jgi:hypothetical protein